MTAVPLPTIDPDAEQRDYDAAEAGRLAAVVAARLPSPPATRPGGGGQRDAYPRLRRAVYVAWVTAPAAAAEKQAPVHY